MYTVEFGQTDQSSVKADQLPWRCLSRGADGDVYYTKGTTFMRGDVLCMGASVPTARGTKQRFVRPTRGERAGMLIRAEHARREEVPREVAISVKVDKLGQSHPVRQKAASFLQLIKSLKEHPWGVRRSVKVPPLLVTDPEAVSGPRVDREYDMAKYAGQLDDKIEGERLLRKFLGLSVGDEATAGLAAEALRVSDLVGRDAVPLKFVRADSDSVRTCPAAVPAVQNVEGAMDQRRPHVAYNFAPEVE